MKTYILFGNHDRLISNDVHWRGQLYAKTYRCSIRTSSRFGNEIQCLVKIIFSKFDVTRTTNTTTNSYFRKVTHRSRKKFFVFKNSTRTCKRNDEDLQFVVCVKKKDQQLSSIQALKKFFWTSRFFLLGNAKSRLKKIVEKKQRKKFRFWCTLLHSSDEWRK